MTPKQWSELARKVADTLTNEEYAADPHEMMNILVSVMARVVVLGNLDPISATRQLPDELEEAIDDFVKENREAIKQARKEIDND